MKAVENSKGVKLFKWKDEQNMLTISTVPEHGNRLVPSGKTNKQRGSLEARKFNGIQQGKQELTSSHL